MDNLRGKSARFFYSSLVFWKHIHGKDFSLFSSYLLHLCHSLSPLRTQVPLNSHRDEVARQLLDPLSGSTLSVAASQLHNLTTAVGRLVGARVKAIASYGNRLRTGAEVARFALDLIIAQTPDSNDLLITAPVYWPMPILAS